MQKRTKLWAIMLSIVLLLSLLTATALAAPLNTTISTENGESANPDASPAPTEAVPQKENTPAKESPEMTFVEEGETHYAKPDSVVFNNGGIVYNNGAVVYNNTGTVYNNSGTAYNNTGTVYANSGTVYNNSGVVFNNGAEIFSQDGEIRDIAMSGAYKINLPNSLRAYVNIENAIDGEDVYVKEGESLEFTPKDGYTIVSADISSGDVAVNKVGKYTISNLTEDADLLLEIKPQPPVMSLESGSYFSAQKLTISAGENAEIYYTTDGSEPDETSPKYSEPIKIDESTVVNAVAVSKGLEVSDMSSANIGILEITVPEFEKQTEGYPVSDPSPIVVINSGSIEAEIANAEIEGDDAANFILNHHSGQKVPAGRTMDDYWTIRPEGGLKAGNYNAKLIFTTANGEQAEFKLSFKVEAAK